MKSCSRWMAMCVALFCSQAALAAQYAQDFPPGGDSAQAMPFQTELWSATPGRLWVEYSLADNGLGYNGSYATIGAKSRLWNDHFDGRWLFEGQGNVSMESGGFFANLGIERVFSLHNAGADIVIGGWYDYDSDQQGNFAHTFNQFAVNAAIKTRQWDLVGNGYFPVGSTDYTEGDPTGVECFFRNSIVLQAGIDSALRGFDAVVRCRPQSLGMVNGTFELGGYAYGSDLVDDFGGVKTRLGIQVLQGMTLVGELNHDNRFDLTGVVQIGWQFGVSVRGSEYAGLGRDLEPTVRNDHIVRFQQDVILAIDPDTGLPYNVFHVDNTADPAFGNGTVETPFATLAEAEAASGADDIIFVYQGTGTDFNYDNGITLKDGQMLLGEGVAHLIPIQNGQLFLLCNEIGNEIDDLRPRLSNDGGVIVTLANRNTVRGLILEGNGLAVHGIEGDAFPFGPPITDGTIEDVSISNVILHGISLNTIAGNWQFARNDVTGAGFDGISIVNALDPTSEFNFEENDLSANGRDGLHMEDYDGSTFTFTLNTTNGNGRDGMHIENYLNSAGTGGDMLFASPIANNNGRHGIHIVNFDGNLDILNPTTNGNGNSGIALENVTNSLAGDSTFIGTTPDGVSTINNNATGIQIQLTQPGAFQNVTITDSTINGNTAMGILAEASGTGTVLQTNVVNNNSVSNTGGSGMRFTSVQGALHQVLVQNQNIDPLIMNNNGNVVGNAMDFLVGDNSPGQISTLEATIRNIAISNTGTFGLFFDVEEDGQLLMNTENVTINNTGSIGIRGIVNTNANLAVSQAYFDNVDITSVGSDGVQMDIGGGSGTLFDFAFTNGSIRDDYDPNALSDNGFEFNVDGGAGTMARIQFLNNVISDAGSGIGFANNGMALSSGGDTHLLAIIDASTILNNGPGADATQLPYFDGIDVVVDGSSTFSMVLTNNVVVDNYERSLDVNNIGIGSVANIYMEGNTFGSDFGEDAPAPITSTLNDMTVTNGPLATTCLAMSNNFFEFQTFAVNLSAAASFILELDGLTNGPGQPAIPFPVLIVPFGTACEPAIDAEEAFFEANGFPAL